MVFFQKQHRKVASEKIQEYFHEICSKIDDSYQLFSRDPSDVQHEWNRIIVELDKWLERAIRYNFKASLAELSKAINGDGKSAPGPLFKIEIILEPKTVGDTTLSKVKFLLFFVKDHRYSFRSTSNRIWLLSKVL